MLRGAQQGGTALCRSVALIRDEMRVTEVPEKFGVHRDTVHSWPGRYEASGLDGLKDRSHRPRHSPFQKAPPWSRPMSSSSAGNDLTGDQ